MKWMTIYLLHAGLTWYSLKYDYAFSDNYLIIKNIVSIPIVDVTVIGLLGK